MLPSSNWLGHNTFNVIAGVQISLGVQNLIIQHSMQNFTNIMTIGTFTARDCGKVWDYYIGTKR